MLVFIDESGDAGFKLGKGSSDVFVVALVIFDDNLDAEETALKIKRFRREINKSDKFEFKFNKTRRANRIKFLETIKDCKFRVRAIVFKKNKLVSENLIKSKDKFYNYAVKLVLKHNNNSIKNAQIRIDGLGERSFKKSLQVYLRKELNTKDKKILENLKFVDSKKNVLIQLADMISGAIRRSYDNSKTDTVEYKKIISKRIEDEWEFK